MDIPWLSKASAIPDKLLQKRRSLWSTRLRS